MALIAAYEDMKSAPRDTPNGISVLGKRGNPHLPFAIVATYAPGRHSKPHYHNTDQFQIVIDGKGRMGRHDIFPHSVHFARAYTPYGPFVADAEVGLTCLIIRAHPDTGSLHSFDELKAMPDRNPWQITCDAVLPETGSSDVALQPIPEIHDDRGLATSMLVMKPNTTFCTPDSSLGEGLFVVMLRGSLIQEHRKIHGLTLVYVPPDESKYLICAGPEGFAGLILQFPRSLT